jgi:hypothetical protein
VNKGKRKGRRKHGLLPVSCGYEAPSLYTTGVEEKEERHVGRDRDRQRGRGEGRGGREEGRDREREGGGLRDHSGDAGEGVTEHEFRQRMRDRLDQINDRLDRIDERLDRLER